MSRESGYKGSGQFLRVGPAADQLVTISGEGSGLTSAGFTPTAETRVITGGGASYRQLTGVTDWTFPISVDANERTWPLFWNKVGADLYIEWGPLGNDAGKPKVTGKGIITVPVPASTSAIIPFEVNVEADGPIDADQVY